MKESKFEFKAEIKKLLDILSKSLYQHKEVFIRELISNSVDALKKIHFISLTEKDIEGLDEKLKIEIIIDPDKKILTVRDTGIGMTKEELINNLGTIAGSGSQKFLEQLTTSQQLEKKDLDLDIIGQFGIGFYSIFMVADKVEVISKSYLKDESAQEWISDGTGEFTIESADKATRGTEVILYLKEDEDEYLQKFRIESIIKKYSNYVSFPIFITDLKEEEEKKKKKEEEKAEEDKDKEEGADEEELKPVNELEPLWKRNQNEITDEDYKNFYHFISNRYDEYARAINYKIDGQVQFHSIMFIPETAPISFIRPEDEYGLTLYSKNVMIMKNCKELFPQWMRFISGVVDSDDIPLNISRDTIQVNRIMIKIQKLLVKKFFRELDEIIEEAPEKYIKLWEEFGYYLKEGIVSDPIKSETLLGYLRFKTTKTKDDEYRSLEEYVKNKTEDQEEIYYLVGENMNTLKLSPHLGFYNEKGLEVILFDKAIDNFIMMNVHEYKETVGEGDDAEIKHYPFKPVDVTEPIKDKEDSEKDKDDKDDKEKEKLPQNVQKFLEQVKTILGEKILDTKVSDRLYENAVRLANPAGGMTSSMQRAMRFWTVKESGQDFQIPQKIMEFNLDHPIVKGLIEIYDKDAKSDKIEPIITQLFENCLLAEGDLPNPSLMVPRINQLIEMLMKKE